MNLPLWLVSTSLGFWVWLLTGPLLLMAFWGLKHRPRYNHAVVVGPESRVFPPLYENDSFIWVAFSGGGTRSAALAWKVLEVLREIPFPKVVKGEQRVSTLADEIDVISGISGGSFAAAAWCLSRDAPESFRERVLERNLERAIKLKLANPRLLSPHYNRINLAAELYDREIFDGAVFGDLPSRPDLRIHATHLALGSAFSFTPDDFRLVGSDLASYPIGYACAASSAFPVLLSPMTLLNHGETLSLEDLRKRDPYGYGDLADDGRDDVETDLRRIAHEYFNQKSNKYIHLSDGGLVDNQGLQALIDGFLDDGIINTRLNYPLAPLRRLIFINVNAGTRPGDDSGRHAQAPGVADVMEYTMVASMDVLSAKRWIRVRDLCDEHLAKAKLDKDLRFSGMEEPYAIEIGFRKIYDPELQQRCNDIPTRFILAPENLAAIDEATPDLIREDKHMRRLGRSLVAEFVDNPEATSSLERFFGSALSETP